MNTPIITAPEREKYDSIINAYRIEPSKKDRETALNTALDTLSASELTDFLYYVREVSEAPKYICKEIYLLMLKDSNK